jgi:O-antigen/teichoic acid export membrane protein
MNQIKAGALLSYITLILNSVIALLYTPFMTFKLGQAEYGLYSLVASIISTLTVLDLGFGNAVIRYTAKFKAENKQNELNKMFGMFFIIFSIIALLSLAIGGVIYFNLDSLFSQSMNESELGKLRIMFLLLIFNLAFTFIMSVYRSIIVAYERFVFQKLINLIRIILNPIVMIVLLSYGHKAISMVVVQTIFNVLTLLLDYYYCKRKLNIKIVFAKFDIPLLKEVSIYSFWVFLNVIMDRIYWSLGQSVVGVYCGAKLVAVYGIAIQIQQMYMSFSTAISGILLPKITAMITQKGSEKQVSDLFIRTGRLQFIVMSFILSGFVVFGRQFIELWVGNSYSDAYYICLLFFFPLLVPLIQNVAISILQARNQMRFRSLLYLAISLLSFAVSLPLTKHYGVIGCAIATSCALFLGHVLIMNIYYHKKVDLDIISFWKEIIKMSLTPILLSLIAIYVANRLTIDNWLIFFLAIGGFTLIYIPLFWLGSMNNYEKSLALSLINKIRKKKQ